MDRVAVFVDAGYLFAQGSILITGKKVPRGDLTFNIAKAVEFLEKFALQKASVPLLRIYWYDGTSTGPSAQHMALAFQPNVKVRLGFVNAVGAQKGVDSLIVTDMITLARNKSMSDAILLSGDEDLRVGVQQAQEFGIRVHLLGIDSHASDPNKKSQSQFLLQESDSTHMWGSADISHFLLSRSPKPVFSKTDPKPIDVKSIPSDSKSTAAGATLAEIAKQASAEVEPTLIEAILKNYESTGQIPADTDRPLLGKAKRLFGILNPAQKNQIRQDFVAALKLRSKS